MKRSSHHIIIPILAIVLLAVSSCFKTDTGIPSIRAFEELIRERAYVPVSGIKLDITNISLNVEDTCTLTPTIIPSNATEKSVNWTSSNTSVATVDQNGRVIVLGSGVATIIVKTSDGGYTATCSVTVEPEAVDLGLSVKWANCNLGASKPEKYGGYYQWAGMQDVTSTSINLYWGNCPYHTGTSSSTGWTKYIPLDKASYWSDSGTPDNKVLLDLDDDVVHVTFGDKWRMPTDEEWSELTDNCTWTWTTQNGTDGYRVTSNKSGYTGKSIFLPAAGVRYKDIMDIMGPDGYYWCSSLYTNSPQRAFCAYFYSGDVRESYTHRYYGLSVRPVYGEWGKAAVSGVKLDVTNITLTVGDTYTLNATISPSYAVNQNVTWSSDNTNVATVDQSGKVTAVKDGNAIITVKTTDGGYTATCSVTVKAAEVVLEAVDLGLSVKWANLNLGAFRLEEYGGYYQWAGTQDVTSTSINLDIDNCPYHTGTGLSTGWTKYIPSDKASYWSGAGSPDNKTLIDLDDDMAHVTLGDKWRMPTDEEWSELIDNCTWTWTTENGVNGYKVTGRKSGYTDKSIFLPAAGRRNTKVLNGAGSNGYYWCSSLHTNIPHRAYFVNIYSGDVRKTSCDRYYGLSVRPVYGEWGKAAVSGVNLDVTNITLTVGDTYTLNATISPSYAANQNVSWSSDNTGVVSVDQGGRVTAVKDGNATITVKTTDGGYTATCSVTVKAAEVVFEAVDLGLSVKWANWNVGASKPEEYGGYYLWAGTQDVTSTSIYLDLNNCPYHTGTGVSTGWTKYIPSSNTSYWSGSGSPDNKTVIDLNDDVAHVTLGDRWRMPTNEEWAELRSNCTWTWITRNGVNGYKVAGKKSGYTDNSIFLPAAGYRNADYLDNVGSDGDYWSSSLVTLSPHQAYRMTFNSNSINRISGGRHYGFSVRPVYGELGGVPVSGVTLNKTSLTLAVSDTYTLTPTISPSDATERGVSWSSDNTNIATVDQNGKVTAVNAGSATITVKTTDGGYTATCSVTVKSIEIVTPEAVDLGLSVKWANWNLGASKPEEYGGYYQWAGTRDVTSMSIYLDWDNCPYHTGTNSSAGWTKYIPSDKASYWSGSGSPDGKTVLDLDDDVAHVTLGDRWRMPTNEEWKELRGNCTWTWTTQNGVYGYKLTSRKSGYTDKSIFLPAAHYRYADYLYNVGFYGYYWSSSLCMSYPEMANYMYFGSIGTGVDSNGRYCGQSVRPVYGEWGNVPVSGVNLNTANIILTVGNIYTLNATITPTDATEQGVSWSSDNTNIATVDQNGKVTALKEGSATITVKTTSGFYTATCGVTVKPKESVFNAVDLGLSVKWANWNVGASKPEECGGYFQWAGTQDVTSMSIYLDWDNCPYHTGTNSSTGWTKYIPSNRSSYWSGSGSPDNKIILDLDDDVAHVKLGDKWRMPTDEEWNELIENCTWISTIQNGVEGYEVISKKSGYTNNSIFLPVAGRRYYGYLGDVSSYGYYWSSSLNTSNPSDACQITFCSLFVRRKSDAPRVYGLSVRPVYGEWGKAAVSGVKLDVTKITITVGDTYTLKATISPSYAVNQNVTWSSDNTGVATVDQNGKVTAVNAGSATITVRTTDGGYTATCSVTVKQPELAPPEAVDLGLSVKWASWNLGASKPEEYGGYYQWAGTQDVTDENIFLDLNNCPYHTGSSEKTGWTKYVPSDKSSYWSSSGSPDNKTVLDPGDDVAHVSLGGNWRIPTDAEWVELKENCTWTWMAQNGVYGYELTSKKSGYTDRSIFLPAAGHRQYGSLSNVGTHGYYKSSSLDTYTPELAYFMYFYSDGVSGAYGSRCNGRTVRPVQNNQEWRP